MYGKLYVICHNNFTTCAQIWFVPVTYPVVTVMGGVKVTVRVPVRVRGTLTVQVRASNKAVCNL